MTHIRKKFVVPFLLLALGQVSVYPVTFNEAFTAGSMGVFLASIGNCLWQTWSWRKINREIKNIRTELASEDDLDGILELKEKLMELEDQLGKKEFWIAGSIFVALASGLVSKWGLDAVKQEKRWPWNCLKEKGWFSSINRIKSKINELRLDAYILLEKKKDLVSEGEFFEDTGAEKLRREIVNFNNACDALFESAEPSFLSEKQEVIKNFEKAFNYLNFSVTIGK